GGCACFQHVPGELKMLLRKLDAVAGYSRHGLCGYDAIIRFSNLQSEVIYRLTVFPIVGTRLSSMSLFCRTEPGLPKRLLERNQQLSEAIRKNRGNGSGGIWKENLRSLDGADRPGRKTWPGNRLFSIDLSLRRLRFKSSRF